MARNHFVLLIMYLAAYMFIIACPQILGEPEFVADPPSGYFERDVNLNDQEYPPAFPHGYANDLDFSVPEWPSYNGDFPFSVPEWSFSHEDLTVPELP